MIYDRVCNLTRYRRLSPSLDRAIDFLLNSDLSGLPQGRVSIDGDLVFGNHFSYTTMRYATENMFESHQKYLDLHIVLRGVETVAVSAEEELQKAEVRESEDATLYRGEPDYTLTLNPSKFILLFPGEAHMPKLIYGSPLLVDKLVLKIIL